VAQETLSLRSALLWVAFSTLIVSGGGFAIWWGQQRVHQARLHDLQTRVAFIAQPGPLPTEYLAEILTLDREAAPSLYALSPAKAEESLRGSPWITSAHVRRRPPNTLEIDYAIVEPVARCGHDPRFGLDKTGRLFPLEPYFHAAEFPQLFGLDHLSAALSLIDRARELTIPLRAVDFSRLEAQTMGRREIVLELAEESPILLRLPVKNYLEALPRYLLLRRRVITDLRRKRVDGRYTAVVDLRLENLAYLSYGQNFHSRALELRDGR
jgi:cell division septal protein FtsQ